MTDEMRKTLSDLKTQEETGARTLCPRCGINRLKAALHTNALSRYVDGVYVCDECGLSEALLDYMNNPIPTEAWAIFQENIPQADCKGTPGAEVWEKIRMEHGPVLIRLYKRWKEDPKAANPIDFNLEARKSCPGLRQLWTVPFQAAYDVADGELILRVFDTADGVEVVGNLLYSHDDDEEEW